MGRGRKANLYGRSRAELVGLFEAMGLPAYRGRQLFRHLYRRHLSDFGRMTDLGLPLREELRSRYRIAHPRLAGLEQSEGGTAKLLVEFEDGVQVETVAIPTRRKSAGQRSGRALSRRRRAPKAAVPEAGNPSSPAAPRQGGRRDLTVCVSTQAGCPLACTFCRSGAVPFRRNLGPGEIAAQVMLAERVIPGGARPRRRNVVFMGMGEPLLNTAAVIASLDLLCDPGGFAIPPRRITVSTVGLPEEMHRLAAAAPQVGIAVSLHAGDDATRTRFMPIGKRHSIGEVLRTIEELPGRDERRITIEYVLLGGENDDRESARSLTVRLRSLSRAGIRPHVNLIAFNPWSDPAPGPPHRPGSEEDAERFLAIVAAAGFPVTLRRSRGREVLAACGQLAATEPSTGL